MDINFKQRFKILWCFIQYKYKKLNKNIKIMIVGSGISLGILFFTVMIVDVVVLEGIFGQPTTKSIQELHAEVQGVTDESVFRIKVNGKPSMDVNTGGVNIIVQNAIDNPFYKQVKYYRQEELVYETRKLSPGENELTAEFEGRWIEGTHELIAEVIAIDMETTEEFIVTILDIELTVKEK